MVFPFFKKCKYNECMYTWQDFIKITNESDLKEFVLKVIDSHKGSSLYEYAKEADLYDKQKNVTINEYTKKIYKLSGEPVVDFTSSNAKIASNFFHRLNVQRCTYSLGNGVTFSKDGVKEKLGSDFDIRFKKAGYNAIIHGLTFLYWNVDKFYNFKITEFAPLFDEFSGKLMAGVRFWQLDDDKPMIITLYEPDGFREWSYYDGEFTVRQEKVGYKKIRNSVAGKEISVTYDNYGKLPIVPFYGSTLHQSTLVGMKSAIDNYDLINSGFANDLSDCAQIYWLLSGCEGMTSKDLAQFRDRLMLTHIASVPEDGVKIDAHTQEIPYQARITLLQNLRKQIYEDFGAFDVSNISSGAKTATEIKASYQPLDENADDFEFQCAEAIRELQELAGIEVETPIFKRNVMANEAETVNMVVLESQFLDTETVLKKLPNISPEEIPEIMKKKALEDKWTPSDEEVIVDEEG